MTANLLFFSIYVNWSYQLHFRVKIISNFAHASEASKANFHENERICLSAAMYEKGLLANILDHNRSAELV